jgi:hypothetical protein
MQIGCVTLVAALLLWIVQEATAPGPPPPVGCNASLIYGLIPGDSTYSCGSIPEGGIYSFLTQCTANCTDEGLTGIRAQFHCGMPSPSVYVWAWSDNPLVCVFQCTDYSFFSQNNYTSVDCVQQTVVPGTVCTANCSAQGATDVQGVFVCDLDGEFVGNPIDCAPAPPPATCDIFALAEQVPAMVSIDCTPDDENPSALGTQCRVSCLQPGYNGTATYTCLGNNTWVGCPLSCQPVVCPLFRPDDEEDKARLHNCTGPHVTGQQCTIFCRGKYRYCGTHSGQLTCTGVAPGVSEWVGYQECCRRYNIDPKKDKDDHKHDKDKDKDKDKDDHKRDRRRRSNPRDGHGAHHEH